MLAISQGSFQNIILFVFFSSLGVKIQPIQLIFSQDITQGFIGYIIPRRIGDLKLCPLGLRLPAGVSHQENVVLSIQKTSIKAML